MTTLRTDEGQTAETADALSKVKKAVDLRADTTSTMPAPLEVGSRATGEPAENATPATGRELAGAFADYDTQRRKAGWTAMVVGAVWSMGVLGWALCTASKDDMLSWKRSILIAAALAFGFGLIRMGDKLTTPFGIQLRMAEAKRPEPTEGVSLAAALETLVAAIAAVLKRRQ